MEVFLHKLIFVHGTWLVVETQFVDRRYASSDLVERSWKLSGQSVETFR